MSAHKKEPTLTILKPMTPERAGVLLERLDDSLSRNITKGEARAALMAFLRAHDAAADEANRAQFLIEKAEAERDALLEALAGCDAFSKLINEFSDMHDSSILRETIEEPAVAALEKIRAAIAAARGGGK